MTTAVIDIDLERLPPEISGLEKYQRALVLIRLRGRPVGQALLTVAKGKLTCDELHDSLLYYADSGFWEQWLRNFLNVDERHAFTTPQFQATVAVCTRDRPDDLQRCLNALMRLHDDGQEFIIIDNCPLSEDTRRLVEKYGRVRYVCEPKPGLDVARNRAIREAKHEIIAFTDDDAAPDPNWLRALLNNFGDPIVMCVTGLTMPLELKTEAQEYFQRAGGLGRGFKRTVYDSAFNDPLEGWLAGAGANMAFRKIVFDSLGLFDERLDVGTPVRGGGDTDMFRRILAAGYRIIYDPVALNWHRHRTEWGELRRQVKGYESAGFAVWTKSLLVEKNLGAIMHAMDWLRREIPELLRSLMKRPGSAPRDLIVARFCGAILGPWLYFYSHRLMIKSYRSKKKLNREFSA
jgi:GT2 family glycosyltransferase